VSAAKRDRPHHISVLPREARKRADKPWKKAIFAQGWESTKVGNRPLMVGNRPLRVVNRPWLGIERGWESTMVGNNTVAVCFMPQKSKNKNNKTKKFLYRRECKLQVTCFLLFFNFIVPVWMEMKLKAHYRRLIDTMKYQKIFRANISMKKVTSRGRRPAFFKEAGAGRPAKRPARGRLFQRGRGRGRGPAF
jgi:hypothetical protein